MNTQKNNQDKSILLGAKQILSGSFKITSGIFALTGFACIVGWRYATAYFSVFGADWIKNELTFNIFISYSWWPVIVVIFFSFIGILNLAQIENDKNFKQSFRYNSIYMVLKHGLWIIILIQVGNLLCGYYNVPYLALCLSSISVVLVVAMSSAAIQSLALIINNYETKNSLPILWTIYLVVFFVLFEAPAQMGRNSAFLDKSQVSTSFPAVALKDNDKTIYRLLISIDNKFYIFPEKYKTQFPPISIVSYNEIKSVQKNNQKRTNNNRIHTDPKHNAVFLDK